MTNHVIDATDRFPARRADKSTRTETRSEQDVQADWAAREQRTKREAAELRKRLSLPEKLKPADRSLIVRNLGRAIERYAKEKEKPTAIAARLFRTCHGEKSGASMEKKRKRYIRFENDASHTNGDQYAANGREFLRLAEGLADMLYPTQLQGTRRDQMLLAICDGVSFYGPSRPQVLEDISLFDQFRRVIGDLTDRVAQRTDVVSYFDQAQNYNIVTHPQGRSDISDAVRKSLSEHRFPVERFEHNPTEQSAYEEYSRLRLGGFDIRAEGVSHLFPAIRIARVYWPQQVLCLPAFVDTDVLRENMTRELTLAETEEAWATFSNRHAFEKSEYLHLAIDNWRSRQEYGLWLAAIRRAGFDPDTIDWHSFENPQTGEALNGAEWRIFYNTLSIDLHLVADGQPGALQFGISAAGGIDGHWTSAPRTLSKPMDDNRLIAEQNFDYYDPMDSIVPWFEDGKKTFVSRGLFHSLELPSDDPLGDETVDIEFDRLMPEKFTEWMQKPLWPLQSPEMWDLLTMRMENWQSGARGQLFGSTKKQDLRPVLRPLFDAPSGWTPAPDGTLASAILASLAYGSGSERLDEKFIAATNNIVRCFVDMKNDLTRNFSAALEQHGYQKSQNHSE